MDKTTNLHHALAESITKSASKQTYHSIRFFVDRSLVPLAYQAYAYFRWVDDTLDCNTGSKMEKVAFVERQVALMEAFYLGEIVNDLSPEERMLENLVKSDTQKESELASYVHNMMAVMVFDAERRGRTISQLELDFYTQALAVAVTDALHYFIGNSTAPPRDENRYTAVTAAHITHMLRDSYEDIQAGYFNTPREYLQYTGISENDLGSANYQKWVCQQVRLARENFKEGRNYLSRVKNLRCRLVGYAYAARFEWVLNTIARENYCLRSGYPERKKLSAGLWMVWKTLSAFLSSSYDSFIRPGLSVEGVSLEEI